MVCMFEDYIIKAFVYMEKCMPKGLNYTKIHQLMSDQRFKVQ